MTLSSENDRHASARPTSDTRAATAATRMGKSSSGRHSEIADELPLVGKFRLGKELGRGGSGVVKVATDTKLRRELAIKMLALPHNGEPGSGTAPASETPSVATAKFVEEAQITGQLQHPNIVPVYELGDDAHGQPFLAMKRVRGQTLTAAIRHAHEQARKTDAPPAEVSSTLRRLLEIFLKACDAVAYAHSRGVVHRDLKPDNIMVGKFGEVLVMDWGLAKVITASRSAADGAAVEKAAKSGSEADIPVVVPETIGATDTIVISDRREAGVMTMHGAVMGTPAYMAPEQAGGMGHQIDEGADIYALGGTLYTILTSKLPVEGRTAQELLTATLEHRIVAPSRRLGKQSPAWVPRELEAVVIKAMARRRKDRYATVEDLKAEILRYLDGATLQTVDYTWSQRILKWVARRKAAVIGAMATLAALVVGLIAVVVVQYAGEISRLHLEAQSREESEMRLRAEVERQRLQTIVEREAIERRALALEKEAIEIRAKEAQLVALAQQGRIEALERQQRGDLREQANAAISEFLLARQAAVEAGMTTWQFVEQMPAQKMDDYISAFSRLILAHDERGDEVPVTLDDYFYWAVLIYYGQRDWARTEQILATAIERDPEFAEAHLLRSFAAINSRNSTNAIIHCNRAILYDSHAAAYTARSIFRSNFYLGTIRPPATQHSITFAREPLADLGYAIERDPDNSVLFFNRSFIKYRLRHFEDAITDVTRAIELDSTLAVGYYRRGQAKYQLDDLVGARADFERAFELDPNNWESWPEPYCMPIPHHILEIHPQELQIWLKTSAARLSYKENEITIFALQHIHRLSSDPAEKQRIANRIRGIGGTVPTD